MKERVNIYTIYNFDSEEYSPIQLYKTDKQAIMAFDEFKKKLPRFYSDDLELRHLGLLDLSKGKIEANDDFRVVVAAPIRELASDNVANENIEEDL